MIARFLRFLLFMAAAFVAPLIGGAAIAVSHAPWLLAFYLPGMAVLVTFSLLGLAATLPNDAREGEGEAVVRAAPNLPVGEPEQ